MKFQRWVLLFGAFLTVLGVLGGLLLPAWARPNIEAMLSSTLHRTVLIEKMSFNPFTLKATLYGVSIKEQKDSFIDFNYLGLDFELASLWKRAPVIRELVLNAPKLKISRLSESEYNFSDLIDVFNKGGSEGSAPFSINNIKIEDGRIDFDDQFLHTKQKIEHLEIALPSISTLAHQLDEYILPHVSGELNGTKFKLDAKSKPFKNNKDTQFTFDFKKLNIQPYTQYVKLPDDLKIASAELSGKVSLHFDIEKEKVKLIISGPVQLDHFNASLKDKPLIKINSLRVDIKDIEPLLGKYYFSEVYLDGLDTVVEKEGESEFNWQKIFKNNQEKTASSESNKLEIAKVKVENSRVRYQGLQFNQIKLDANSISTEAGKISPVQLSVKTDQGEQFSADLKVVAQPFSVDGSFDMKALQLEKYADLISPYFKGEVNHGELDASSKIHIASNPFVLSMKETDIKLNQFLLRLPKEKKTLLSVDQFFVKGLDFDSEQKSIQALELQSKGGQLGAEWLANGQFNFAALLPNEHAEKASAKPWRVQVSKIVMDDWGVNFSDQRLAKAPSVNVHDISLQFNHLDTAANQQGKLQLKGHWGSDGLIDLNADIVPLPFSAQMALDLRNVDAAFLQPYFTQFLNIALARGLLNAKGNLQLVSQPQLNAHYRGALSVNRFYALDKQTSSAFLKWNRLDLKGIDAVLLPLKVDIAEIALDKYFSRLILSPSGRLNLQDILVHDGKQVSVAHANTASAVVAAPVAKTLAPVSIKKIVLSNGDIRYSDFFIKPNFTANLNKMAGVIYGLSSAENALAQLDISGFVDKTAPVKVSGTLNPLSKKIFLDLKGGVKNYDLTSASTYSAKYAGYGIEKGKMSMDIAYKIEGSKLLAENKIFLDQLTLSDEKIDSTDATKLPVKLALSLLTDRRGQINLNLPIEGSLDDPQFSVSGVIWQVVGNVLEKIVTSPFDALASAIGHEGATLSQVEFLAGSEKMDEKSNKSIKQLAEVLVERPGLKLEIQSLLNPIADKEGLKARVLQKKIRQVKSLSMANRVNDDESEILISKDEYPSLLEKVYRAEKFEKPSNLIGMDKSLSVPEMEKLIFEHTDIKNDDLYALGLRRAALVKAALLAAGVDEARLFLVKSALSHSADLKPQVKFALK